MVSFLLFKAIQKTLALKPLDNKVRHVCVRSGRLPRGPSGFHIIRLTKQQISRLGETGGPTNLGKNENEDNEGTAFSNWQSR